MPLIKHGRIIADSWTAVADDDAPPADGPLLISPNRWERDRAALLALGRPLGIRLAGDSKLDFIAGDLGRFSLVVVEFAVPTDGRGYSIGRLLRTRYGYEGELRATGGFIRDLFPFLHRCGFDTIEARDEKEAAAWVEAVRRVDVSYQAIGDRPAAFALRQRRPSQIPP